MFPLALIACGGDESPERASGREVAAENGCLACHGADGEGGAGPAWTGLAGSTVTLVDGTTVTADTEYLTRAIGDPGAQIVEGWGLSMPENDLADSEIAAVVDYIESLR
jgi:cytochrome c oxidase subunit 2